MIIETSLGHGSKCRRRHIAGVAIGIGLCDLGKLPETDPGQIRASVRPELASGSKVNSNVSTTARTCVTK